MLDFYSRVEGCSSVCSCQDAAPINITPDQVGHDDSNDDSSDGDNDDDADEARDAGPLQQR